MEEQTDISRKLQSDIFSVSKLSNFISESLLHVKSLTTQQSVVDETQYSPPTVYPFCIHQLCNLWFENHHNI